MMNSKNSPAKNGQSSWQQARLSLLIILTVIFTFIACKGQSSAAGTQTTTTAATPVISSSAGAVAAPQGSYADLVARVAPAVVTIHSTEKVKASTQRNPLMDDPRFRELFGDRMTPQQPRRMEGLGSGVIVSGDGYILTNNHVVEGADTVRVDLSDRRTVDAKVVGTDPLSDLAVLKIQENNLPVLPLGDSDKSRIGDVALAIGNPLGIGQTVTSGIISAKGRTSFGAGDGGFEDFIQTDAPINRGNSGGALINTNGELIGINSQIVSPSGGSIGIGFAIPSNMARSVMDQLIKTGKVRRSLLGVFAQNINSDVAASLNLKDLRGVLVSTVQSDSAAARAGVKVGDVITAINSNPVMDSNSFRNTVANFAPGTQIALTILRDEREQQVRATLSERTEEVAKNDNSPEGGPADPNNSSGKLGLTVEPLTADLAQQLKLQTGTQGVVVKDVDPNGPAADAQIREGDVITQINRQPVRSITDVRTAVQSVGTRPILLLVNRGGQSVFLTVRPQQQ